MLPNEILKQAEKCTRCGNCQYYCPTYTASRIESYTARGRLELVKIFGGQASQAETSAQDSTASLDRPAAPAYSETFVKRMNQCLLCSNCSEICPSGIKIPEIIEAMRAACNQANGPTAALAQTGERVSGMGNITGDQPANRLLWFSNIASQLEGMKIGQTAEYAYFTGCVPALYPSSYSIPQSFVRVLCQAGVDFTLIGEAEVCCGYPLLIGGLPADAAQAARHNLDTLRRLGIRKIITTCPSCYHMWQDLYPQLLGEATGIELIHVTQMLERLLGEGKIKLKPVTRTVTFHDPCDLGRKSGEYDAPRRVLAAIPGLAVKEMKHSREDARCCGGGGNIEMNDAQLGGKVAQDRVRQALATGADTIVTACQQCKRTLLGGARQMKARIKVADISEIVLEALDSAT